MAGCDTLAPIVRVLVRHESMYGKAPMYMTACEEMLGLPGDVFVGGEECAVVLLNDLRK